MGYAELISRLQVLPEAKQAEVFDFVEFLASREVMVAPAPLTLGQTSWAELLKNPMRIPDFTPLSREEANER
jgi:Protein of unknown function (DUF2281)